MTSETLFPIKSYQNVCMAVDRRTSVQLVLALDLDVDMALRLGEGLGFFPAPVFDLWFKLLIAVLTHGRSGSTHTRIPRLVINLQEKKRQVGPLFKLKKFCTK